MNLLRTTKLALRNMLANKMRAGLSSLGIIIGVLSVVVLLAVGEGATSSIVNTVSALGTNLLTISPGSQNSGNVRQIGGSNTKVFTMDHVEIIKEIEHVSKVAPLINTSKQLVYSDNNTSAIINGVTPDYETVNNTSVTAGTFITQSAVDNREKVAVLGPTVVTNLFETEDPIGKTIKIGNSLYTVIGVTKSKGSGGRNSSDSAVFVPITTAEISLAGTKYLSSISVMVDSEENMTTTKDAVTEKLLEVLGIADSANATFTVSSQEDTLDTLSSITSTLKLFLGGIAAISLIVGGIGVMNILLVTVSERTKEIGIRKAIGAKSRDIIEQFLVESVLLTVVGGAIGIFLSYVIVFTITSITTAITPVITTNQILLALSFSVGTGLFFGIFPAYKAAKLKPIDALRTE
ncbi:MAG: ABC transporter permease [Candidatus Gracilibacteria bacterium]|nr:ABC transporter permease [Candidatus Gracilibacteria bacterium]